MLKLSDFKDVSLDDRDFFLDHYRRSPQVHSDNAFTNMVCWNHYAHYGYAFYDGCIILCSTIGGKTRYRMPIGPQNQDLLMDLIALAVKSQDDLPLLILDPESKDWISRLYPELNLYPERKYFDYVYYSRDLAILPGKRFATIRRQLNQFQKNCSPIVEPISEDNLPEIQEFLELWCDWKDCDSDPVLAHEKQAVHFALNHFRQLKLSGLGIRVKGKIGAMAVFERLNDDTALVHFEKGLPECKGIYRAINAETAKSLAKDYVYINRESDMGVEGIREAKMRYHPHHMVEVLFMKKEELEKII